MRRLALLFLLFAAPAFPAHPPWLEVATPHFTVISNASEKDARRIADQFEQIREVYIQLLPKFRTDFGKPVLIFAARNETTLKQLLPVFWETPGRMHPAGIFVSGIEANYMALRTDLRDGVSYEVLYHEYAHALLHLNFRYLPVWLDEGLAEFFANSELHDSFAMVGEPAPNHLVILQQSTPLPVETLVQVDRDSPYYNERNRTSLFYAESWALVHYLMLDESARHQQLLSNYITAWNSSGNALEAARQSFGDLRALNDSLSLYVRQKSFKYGQVKTSLQSAEKSYSTRTLSPAELDSYRALFFLNTHRIPEAKSAVAAALAADPNLPAAHEARGLLAWYQDDFPLAESEFARAIELHSTNFAAFYYDGASRLRSGSYADEGSDRAIASLEHSIRLNPRFAPAYAALGSVYSAEPDKLSRALEFSRKAVDLEPARLSYSIDYCYVLVNLGRLDDARSLSAQISAAAQGTSDQAASSSLAQVVAEHLAFERESKALAAAAFDASRTPPPAPASDAAPESDPPSSPGDSSIPLDAHPQRQLYAVEGRISSSICGNSPGGRITLTVNSQQFHFQFPDLRDLQITEGDKDVTSQGTTDCREWIGRRARLYFLPAPTSPTDDATTNPTTTPSTTTPATTSPAKTSPAKASSPSAKSSSISNSPSIPAQLSQGPGQVTTVMLLP